MKDILLKKDLIAYLIHEIERVKKTTPQECELHNYSFVQGHKEGQLKALYDVLNYVNGINTKYSAKHSGYGKFD